MSSVQIRDMGDTDEYFVGTCSHIDETDEIDVCAKRRIIWLRNMQDKGLRVKVAILDGYQVGFLYVIPIEICPWGPLGEDLMVLPCLWVLKKAQNKGIGRALVASAEQETKHQKRKALTVIGFYHDIFFMQASFFEKLDFSVARRRDKIAILWKVFDKSAKLPKFLESNYMYKPVPGKIVVDLFWHSFCLTSVEEAQRVREVAAEFGNVIVLNEYCVDDRAAFLRYQIPRAIFINGIEIGWGYEAPKEGIREAISKALNP